MHDPAVVREVLRRAGFRLVEQRSPKCGEVEVGGVPGDIESGDAKKGAEAVEGAVQRRVTDGVRPELACLAGAKVVVGQRAHL